MGGNSAALYINPKTTQQCRLLAQSGHQGRTGQVLSVATLAPLRVPLASQTASPLLPPHWSGGEARGERPRSKIGEAAGTLTEQRAPNPWTESPEQPEGL